MNPIVHVNALFAFRMYRNYTSAPLCLDTNYWNEYILDCLLMLLFCYWPCLEKGNEKVINWFTWLKCWSPTTKPLKPIMVFFQQGNKFSWTNENIFISMNKASADFLKSSWLAQHHELPDLARVNVSRGSLRTNRRSISKFVFIIHRSSD